LKFGQQFKMMCFQAYIVSVTDICIEIIVDSAKNISVTESSRSLREIYISKNPSCNNLAFGLLHSLDHRNIGQRRSCIALCA